MKNVTIVAATQLGKTVWLMSSIAYLATQHPAPCILCSPDRPSTIELRDRMYSNHLESPTLSPLVPPEHKRNSRYLDLGVPIYLAWSGSSQRLRSRPCRYAFETELDVYRIPAGGHPSRTIEERAKNFYLPKFMKESSLVGEDSHILAEYKVGDRRRLWSRCPICGFWQVLRFFPHRDGEHQGNGGLHGFRNQAGDFLPEGDIRQHVHYRCVRGCEIPEAAKDDLTAGSVWARDGETVVDGKIAGEPAEKASSHRSYWMWSIHSRRLTFGDIAWSYRVHDQTNTLDDYYQNWLSLVRFRHRRLPKYHQVGLRHSGAHPRGHVWPDAWFLTSFTDVQEDRCYYVVRAWGHDKQSWLVDWDCVRRHADEETEGADPMDLVHVSQIVWGRRWPVAFGKRNPLGKEQVGCRLCLIDYRYGHRQSHVSKAVARCLDTPIGHNDRVRIAEGDTSVKAAERWKQRKVDPYKTNGLRSKWSVNVNIFKEEIQEWIVTGNRKWLLTQDITKPEGADYLRQIVNERFAEVENKRTGRTQHEWQVISGRIGNHYWDCEVGCDAAAEMVLAEQGLTWDSRTWPTDQDHDGEPVDLLPRGRDD